MHNHDDEYMAPPEIEPRIFRLRATPKPNDLGKLLVYFEFETKNLQSLMLKHSFHF